MQHFWNMQNKLVASFAAVAILTNVLLTATLYGQFRAKTRHNLRERLGVAVGLAALQLDADTHAGLRTPADEASPAYRALKAQLQRVHALAPDTQFVYTMRQDDAGRIRCVVDDERDPATVSHIGDVLEPAGAALRTNFASLTGPVVEREFYRNASGTWLSGYAPFFRRDGTLEGVLGMDLDADRVLAPERETLGLALLILAPTVLLAVALGWLLGRHLAAPIRALQEGANRVARGRLDATVLVRHHDEIGDCAAAFNRMAGELVQARQKQRQEFTERHQTLLTLQETERHYRELADSLPLSIFEIDANGRFTFVNRLAWSTFGYPPDTDLTRLQVADIIAPRDRESARENFRRLMAGEEIGFQEYLALRKDGSTFPIMARSQRVCRRDAPPSLRGFLVDMTDKRALEEATARRQQLESLGLLAGGIAHDFNNLLVGILGNLALARSGPDGRPGELGELLQDAEDAARQAKELTQQLLTFAQDGAPIRHPAALKTILETSARFVLRGSASKYRLRIAPDLWPVEVDATQISQVIQNLVLNADQAMPGGGEVLLEAGNLNLTDPSGLPLPPGPYVRVAVVDHGPGIPAEHREKLFGAYFTTKVQGRGLGLATAASILKKHHGHIRAVTRPGAGAVFEFYLPASAAIPAPPPPAAAPHTTRNTGRILVMDDGEQVLQVLRRTLEGYGFECVVTPDGARAVAAFAEAERSGRPFRAVILDLTVPGGMGGREALRRLRQVNPRVRAIISSGYAHDPVMKNCRAQGFAGALAKPYVPEELVRVLEEALRDGPSQGLQAAANRTKEPA